MTLQTFHVVCCRGRRVSDVGARLQKTGAYSSLLSIGSADPRLNGNYTCTASNAAATVQHTAALHVDGKCQHRALPACRLQCEGRHTGRF